MAHCGREPYHIWKAGRAINHGIQQMRRAINILNNDENLLFSALKKDGIISKKEEIRKVIFAIITSSNYFSQLCCGENISVIGLEMLSEILWNFEQGSIEKVVQYVKVPFSLYEFSSEVEKTVSEIDQKEFRIFYEEFE